MRPATGHTFRRSVDDGCARRRRRRALALTRPVNRGYTTPAMRILTSVLLAAFVLTLPLSVIAAPSLQPTIDIKTLALTKGDLKQPGFDIVPERTVSEDRTDGVAIYDVTFARERSAANLASGPFEVRSGVARTAQVDDAVLQLESTREAFLAEGWTTMGVPALGDETLGLTQTTDGEGGQIAHYSYLFRKNAYILMIGIRGRPEAIKLADVVELAIVVSGRIDKALAGGAPAASSESGASQSQSAGERVRVVNAEGGAVNIRSEPTTSSNPVAQVTDGTTLDIVGPNRDGDTRTWRNVRTSDGKSGWIASTLVETISAPAPPVAPSPGPSPAPERSSSGAPTESTDSTPPADEPAAEASEASTEEAEASPSPSPSPTSESSTGATFKGSGNGLAIEGIIRNPTLSSGKQLVKVRVTRNGGGVADAFVDVTARLDATRYRAIKVDKTNNDGWTEVEWDMEGPAGTYEVLVEVKTSETGPVTSAKGSFRWQ